MPITAHFRTMATPELTQNYEDSVYGSTIDFKVPTALELPVEDLPQELRDILSPDLSNGDTDSPARQLVHENGTVGMSTSSIPIVAPSTKTSTDLLATTEASPDSPPDDKLPSTTDNIGTINGETYSSTQQLGHDDSAVGTITPSTPMIVPSTETRTNLPATTEASLNNAPYYILPSTTEGSVPSTDDTSLPPTPDICFPKIQGTLAYGIDSTFCEKPSEKLALRILDVVQSYAHGTDAGTGVDWTRKNNFLSLVEQSIEKSEAVKMVLPAFPCVSVLDCCPFRAFLGFSENFY